MINFLGTAFYINKIQRLESSMKDYLAQPCFTSGQLTECVQKAHCVPPNAPLPQKKIDSIFCLAVKFENMNIQWGVQWLQYSVTSIILATTSIRYNYFLRRNKSCRKLGCKIKASKLSLYSEGDTPPSHLIEI